MATFTYTGWRTVVLKQSFEIEANTQEEANAILWKRQENFELGEQWFDLSTAEIKVVSDEEPDFYDNNDDLVERI